MVSRETLSAPRRRQETRPPVVTNWSEGSSGIKKNKKTRTLCAILDTRSSTHPSRTMVNPGSALIRIVTLVGLQPYLEELLDEGQDTSTPDLQVSGLVGFKFEIELLLG